MGKLVKLVRGVWNKNSNGEWFFEDQRHIFSRYERWFNENEKFETLLSAVKSQYLLPDDEEVVLTYRFPECISPTEDYKDSPMDIKDDSDVELFMALRVHIEELEMCVTIGERLCREYSCRRSIYYLPGGGSIQQQPAFQTGDQVTRLLTEPIIDLAAPTPPLSAPQLTLGQSVEVWEGRAGRDHILCSDRVLREIFNENELELIYENSYELLPLPNQNEDAAVVGPISSSDSTGDVSCNSPRSVFPQNEFGLHLYDTSETDLFSDSLTHEEVPMYLENATSTIEAQLEGTNLGVRDKGKAKVYEFGESSQNPLGLGLATTIYEPKNQSNEQAADSDSMGSEDLEDEDAENVPDIYVGKVYKDRDEFKNHMQQQALAHKFRFRNSKSSPGKMVLSCRSRECPWRVMARKLNGTDTFQIRNVHLEHHCSVDVRRDFHKGITSNFLGDLIRSQYKGAKNGPTPNDLRRMILGEHEVNISYWKAWRARQIALESVRGNCKGSYTLLPAYLQQLVKANPASLVAIETMVDDMGLHHFKYLFFALGVSIRGYAYLRKVVVVDGAHLKGKYGGCLLSACGQDGNYQVFPIAFAIVDSENDASWEWFFRKLSAIVPDEPDVVFVSDRHGSIKSALAKVYPNAGHCACILHLQRNIQTLFKAKNLSYVVARAARAYRVSDFYTAFRDIKRMDPKCADYLLEIGLPHWARSQFPGRRYNVMTSNVVEVWNGVLKDARDFPVISLMEFMRSIIGKWSTQRLAAAEAHTLAITPKVHEIISAHFEASSGFEVRSINPNEYDVRTKEGVVFCVNLRTRTCNCLEFQSLMIPCPHAVAAARFADESIESLVADEYTTKVWKLTYQDSVYPVQDIVETPQVVDALTNLELHPPSVRRPPGRPRKRRFFSRGEFKVRGVARVMTCGRCGMGGHNRKTCKNPI